MTYLPAEKSKPLLAEPGLSTDCSTFAAGAIMMHTL
jgi:hypothetical protein